MPAIAATARDAEHREPARAQPGHDLTIGAPTGGPQLDHPRNRAEPQQRTHVDVEDEEHAEAGGQPQRGPGDDGHPEHRAVADFAEPQPLGVPPRQRGQEQQQGDQHDGQHVPDLHRPVSSASKSRRAARGRP